MPTRLAATFRGHNHARTGSQLPSPGDCQREQIFWQWGRIYFLPKIDLFPFSVYGV
jgi:hypothetical protein